MDDEGHLVAVIADDRLPGVAVADSRLDPGALCEDAKLGFAHMFNWDSFAMVTDVEWISRTTKFMAMFMPLDGRVYPIAEAA